MKRLLFIFLVCLLDINFVCAADFSPTVLNIEGTYVTVRGYEAKNIRFPFTLNGTSASVWLIVTKHDEASNIRNVRNGYLGWHYVNHIDTVFYISQRYEMNPGQNEIIWDMIGNQGNPLPDTNCSGYPYYLWAYDSKSPRQKACDFISTGCGTESQFVQMIEKDEDGLPLTKPILFGSYPWQDTQSNPNSPDYAYRAHGTAFKWILGSDPENITLLQTTRCPGYGDNVTDISHGGPLLNPTNHNEFFHCAVKPFYPRNSTTTILKWEFISGGLAVKDNEWGGWDNITLEDWGTQDIWSQKPSCYTDGNFIYSLSPGFDQKESEWNRLRVYDWDGNVVMDKLLHEWYMPNDKNPQGFINGSFHLIASNKPNNILLASQYSCLIEMTNTTRLVLDQDDETDMIMWQNSNGDYFMDTAYSPYYNPQWYCLADDLETMRPASLSIDHNGFCIIGVSYYGLASFGVIAQDGSGIGIMQFADDMPGTDKFPKRGGVICDNGSAYDGLYFANVDPLNDTWVPTEKKLQGMGKVSSISEEYTSYCAFDSYSGRISFVCWDFAKEGNPDDLTSSAETNNPMQFSVSQNTPNPFNPSTSIEITLPYRNIVKAEIYNIYGSKVSVLVDGVFEPGRNSLKWNASGLSAGVYFCRVNFGEKTRTIRMTFVK